MAKQTLSEALARLIEVKAEKDALKQEEDRLTKKVKLAVLAGERVIHNGREATVLRQERREYDVATIIKRFPSFVGRLLSAKSSEVQKLSEADQASLPYTVKPVHSLRIVPQRDLEAAD